MKATMRNVLLKRRLHIGEFCMYFLFKITLIAVRSVFTMVRNMEANYSLRDDRTFQVLNEAVWTLEEVADGLVIGTQFVLLKGCWLLTEHGRKYATEIPRHFSIFPDVYISLEQLLDPCQDIPETESLHFNLGTQRNE